MLAVIVVSDFLWESQIEENERLPAQSDISFPFVHPVSFSFSWSYREAIATSMLAIVIIRGVSL